MKKTSKFFTLLVGLVMMFSGIAKAEGFSVGTDVVSRYIWRGTQFGDGIAAQPSLSYTFPGIGVEVGAWGSFEIDNDDNNEIDLYITVPAGNFSFTLTDYYFPTLTNKKFFDYDDDGDHVLEISAGYEYKNLNLFAAYNLLGNDIQDTSDAIYVETGYQFYDKDDYAATVFAGAGDNAYSTDGDFQVVNLGLTVTKDIFSASYIHNPDQEESFFVVGITLEP